MSQEVDVAPASVWEVGFIRDPALQRNRSCRYCGVSLFTGETSGFCCGTRGNRLGDVQPLPPLPHEYDVFINHPSISSCSRILNLLFSFAALESTALFPHNIGPPGFFAIQGKIYHRLRPAHGNSGVRWLLYDGYNMDLPPHGQWAAEISPEWKTAFAAALLRVNPFARALQQLRQVPNEVPHARIEIADSGAMEIAALLRYDNTAAGEVAPRRLVITRNDGRNQTIPTVSRLWEPLAYPLFFPSGTLGWGVIGNNGDIRRAQQQADILPDDVDAPTTQIWHYRARLLREERFQILGRLTNEYVVDMWTRELECRLNYIRTNQMRRRREDAELLGEDAMDLDRDPEERTNIYLPASFLGSRAWASQNVHDSLAVAATYGPPTFFITMTCNTNWEEITGALRPGQTFADIPVVVARVFKQKLSQLLKTLDTMFPHVGPRTYCIHAIEFQKRGLPHAHILVKYPRDCTTPVDIDSVVSAEIPYDPSDAQLVTQFMMHRHPEPHLPPPTYCQRVSNTGERTCRFKFPKPLQPTTTIDNEGRVQYRRRREGDQMVVPHCLPLLRKYRCHINVEVANSSHLFQYAFKYIHKGPDRARFRIAGDDRVDEIEQFWDGRYLSAGEAVWRILGFSITRKDPAVSALPIHLPETHFRHQYHRRNGNSSTLSLLDRYFHRPNGTFITRNGLERTFSSLTYTEYFELFRLESMTNRHPAERQYFLENGIPERERRMCVIQRDPTRPHITRIQPVRLSAGESYYLRAILTARSATCFEDARTIDGVTYDTYQEAAIAMGLFDDDSEANQSIQEAIASLRTPRQLRLLFLHLLVNDLLEVPLNTWNAFKDEFIKDFYLQNNNIDQLGEDLALQELARYLEEYGKTLNNYGLPHPVHNSPEVLHELERWGRNPELLRERAETARASFNPEQTEIFNIVIDAVVNKRPLCIFIDGKAGRGKTFLVNAICNYIRSMGKIVIPTASSAYAAQLYPGGRTTHSAFKVPVNEFSEMLQSSISPLSPRADLLREAALIIWDETPMANGAVLGCCDDVMRQLRNPDRPFGGAPFALLGDWRQTCPVVRRGTRAQVVAASIKMSPLWEHFTTYHLITPIRNAEDLEYANFVDGIGDGAGPEVDLEPFLPITTQPDELADFVFPPAVLQDPASCLTRSILAPTNLQVETYNSTLLDRVDGIQRTFLAADSLKEAEDAGVNGEDGILDYVARRTPSGLPPHSLVLRTGSVVRLMRYFSIDRGMVKNVRAVVQSLGQRLITVQLMNTVDGVNHIDPEVILIPRIRFDHIVHSGHTLQRRQFPLTLAYATTFNSCQGLTLDRIGVDLTRPVFSHGQLYTALSRIRNRNHGMVRLPPGETSTTNVTYREILN